MVVTEKENNSNGNINDNINNNEGNINDIKVESQVAQTNNNESSTINNQAQKVNNKSSKGFNQNQKTPINSINNQEKIIPFKVLKQWLKMRNQSKLFKKKQPIQNQLI